jgi:hypothetical protein
VSTCRSQHIDIMDFLCLMPRYKKDFRRFPIHTGKQSWRFCSIVKEDECHIVYSEKLLILGKSPDSLGGEVDIHKLHFQQGKKAQFVTVMGITTGSVYVLCKVA